MNLTHYANVLRRRRLLVLLAPIAVGLVAWLASAAQTPHYRASADVLLRPNDPAEQPAGTVGASSTPAVDSLTLDRYVTAQLNIVRSDATIDAAAKSAQVPVGAVRDAITATQAGSSEIIRVTAVADDPHRAAMFANAVAGAYISQSRQREIDTIRRTIEGIDVQLAQLLATIGSQPADAAIPDASRAEHDAAVQQYQALYGREQQLRVAIPLQNGAAQIIAPAKPPLGPFRPQTKRNIVLGVVAGLLLGVGIALLEDQLGDTLRSADEVEALTGTPVLTELPYDRAAAKHGDEVALTTRPDEPLAEAVRTLRTAIEMTGTRRPHVILITSPAPGDGATMLVANLGTAFAAGGFRTVLVSGDLRHPRLDALIAGPLGRMGTGLAGVVTSLTTASTGRDESSAERSDASDASPADELADALIAVMPRNLMLLPAGSYPSANPAELLGSPGLGTVFHELSAASDVVIVDSPPVLAVTDPVVLAAHADAVVLVVAVGRTRRRDARRSAETLRAAGAPLVGTVVNLVRGTSAAYRYGDGTTDRKGSRSRAKTRSTPAPAAAADVPTTGENTLIATARATTTVAPHSGDTR